EEKVLATKGTNITNFSENRCRAARRWCEVCFAQTRKRSVPLPLKQLDAFCFRIAVKRRKRLGSNQRAAILIRLDDRPDVFEGRERIAARGAKMLARHAVGDIFQERMNAARERRAEILDA